MNRTVSKTVVALSSPWVRIPLSPPFGAVAQLGERIPRTDEVTGSNPVCSIDFSNRQRLERTFGQHGTGFPLCVDSWKSCAAQDFRRDAGVGLTGMTGNHVCRQLYRGFESHSLRHYHLCRDLAMLSGEVAVP